MDSDHITPLERADSEAGQRLRARLDQLPIEERATTIVNFEEQTRGWLAYVRRQRTPEGLIQGYKKLRIHLDVYCTLRVLDFDEDAARIYQQLRQSRLRIGPMDLRIAAIALAHNATLLTQNLKHFRKVPGLKVEDWTV